MKSETMRVFVLLFNAGTENEGIHTIRMGDRNLVLMFEQEDDATRYALLLEAQDFPTPTVENIDRKEIEDFCKGVDYDCKLVPDGFVPQDAADRLLIAPPEANLEETDWDEDTPPEFFEEPAELPASDLDRIRRQLEGLL